MATNELVTCRHCENSNPSGRKFCGHCGQLLWEPCPKCAVEGPATETFCGSCGANITAVYQARFDSFDADLARAQEFRRLHDYERALDVVAKLTRTHPLRLESRIAAARVVHAEMTAERDSRLGEAARVLTKARELQAAHAYESAVSALDEIPVLLRSEEFQDFFEEVRAQWKEVLSLSGEVRQALEQMKTLELLPTLDRLIQLQPANAQARQLAEQLRDRYVQAAQKRLAANQYADALNLLKDIPDFLRTSEVEDLQVRAAELAWLLADLMTAPMVDKPLLAVAERLLKLAPTNEQVKKLQMQLLERAKTKPKDPRIALPLWAAPPETTRLGLPVDWLGGFERLALAEKARATAAEHPGMLFVAAGLALQGVELSELSVNLAPKQKTSMLGGFTLLRAKKKTSRAAWGLDLSETGLKAVKIVCGEQGEQPTIEACAVYEHKKCLSLADAEIERAEVISATLKAFLAEHDVAGCKVCVSLSSAKMLGRFIDLPPLDKKQVPGVVEYEAKHNIPFPLSELIWDYELLGGESDYQADQSHRVLILAAKEFHVQDTLARFKDAEISIDVLQGDTVALHNLAVYEFFPSSKDLAASRAAVVFVDVGSDSTNVVVSSREGFWFRSVRLGAGDFTKVLVKQFKLSHTQAEQLQRDPTKARRLSQLYEALDPVLNELVREIERSLTAYKNERLGLKVERLFALGGGARMHGVLRHLRVGT